MITHPIIVVGPHDYNSYSTIFSLLASGAFIPVIPGSFQFCHARDVARGHVGAFEKGKTGVGYMLGGPWATWLEVYQKIARLVNVKPPTVTFPHWINLTAGYLSEWASYITRKEPLVTPALVKLLKPGQTFEPEWETRARDTFGYASAPLDVMLKDCYDWMVKEKQLPASATGTR